MFHAFGHEFACQCVYHPQRRVGFGHTDGEGCERCWGQLQKEIATLRISGVSPKYHNMMYTTTDVFYNKYHRRLFILNLRLAHMNEQNLCNLGRWWHEKMRKLYGKLSASTTELRTLSLDETFIREQWHKQVDSVTTLAPGICTSRVFS